MRKYPFLPFPTISCPFPSLDLDLIKIHRPEGEVSFRAPPPPWAIKKIGRPKKGGTPVTSWKSWKVLFKKYRYPSNPPLQHSTRQCQVFFKHELFDETFLNESACFPRVQRIPALLNCKFRWEFIKLIVNFFLLYSYLNIHRWFSILSDIWQIQIIIIAINLNIH